KAMAVKVKSGLDPLLLLDASLGMGLPVKNGNSARSGMPDLNFNLQAGPRLNWQAHKSEQSILTLRLPWRGVMDIKGDYLGWVTEPNFNVELRPTDNLTVKFNGGALFASQQHNATYYTVKPAFSTPARPAYIASGGLHSLSISGSVKWSEGGRMGAFAGVRYRNLRPGVVLNSPLVKTSHYISVAAGFTWSFAVADETVRYTSEHETP
ncbi:MAG: MipA/OmpV family protein, partial [Mariprofundaceae bacterium]